MEVLGAYSNCSNSNSSEFAESVSSLYPKFSFALACIILVCCLLGIPFNALSVFIYTRPAMRAPINVLLTALSAVDLLLLLLAIPAFVIPGMNTFIESMTLMVIIKYTTVCLYPLTLAAQTCSILTLVFITVERYIAVCHPFRSLQFSTSHRMKRAVLIICFLSISYNIVRFWEYRLPTESESPYHAEYELRINKIYYLVYYTTLFLITHFFLPFTILLVLNGLVVRTIYIARRERLKLTRKVKGEHMRSLMMIVIVLIFVTCNSLTLFLNVLEVVDSDFFARELMTYYILNDTSNLLVVLNSATSWIIYYYFIQKYRTLFKWAVFRCCRSQPFENTSMNRLISMSSSMQGKSFRLAAIGAKKDHENHVTNGEPEKTGLLEKRNSQNGVKIEHKKSPVHFDKTIVFM